MQRTILFSPEKYHQQLVTEIADVIAVIERFESKRLSAHEFSGTRVCITPEIITQFQLPESTVPLFMWCLELLHDYRRNFYPTDENFERVLDPLIPEEYYPPDVFINHLHDNVASIAKVATPLLAIIQEYVGDAFSIQQAKLLFNHLTSHPLFASTIASFNEKYLNHFCTTDPMKRDFSVLTKINQGDATPYLIHVHSGYRKEHDKLIAMADRQNFMIDTSVLCTYLFNNIGWRSPEIIELLYKNTQNHARQFTFTEWRYPHHNRSSKQFTVTTSPLLLAIDWSSQSFLADLLLKEKDVRKTVNEKDSRGLFPLYLAALHASHGLIRRLLEAKADPTLRYEQDVTQDETISCSVPVRFGETASECLKRSLESITTDYRMPATEKWTFDLLIEAEKEFKHQHQTEEKFSVIQKQPGGFSKKQKEICRARFSHLFAKFESYAEIVKAFDDHGKAIYTLEQRRRFFKPASTDTKKHLIKVALLAMIRLSGEKLVPHDDELSRLRVIVDEAKALKKKKIDELLDWIYLQIPAFKVHLPSLTLPSTAWS